MFGWGKTSRRNQRAIIEAAARAVNARDYAALGDLLTEDFVYIDVSGGRLESRGDYIAAQRALYNAVPDLRAEHDDFAFTDRMVIVRGRFVSADPAFCVDSMWNVTLRGDRIAEIQTFRPNNAISLLTVLRRERDGARVMG